MTDKFDKITEALAEASDLEKSSSYYQTMADKYAKLLARYSGAADDFTARAEAARGEADRLIQEQIREALNEGTTAKDSSSGEEQR